MRSIGPVSRFSAFLTHFAGTRHSAFAIMRIALDYTTGIYPGAGIARYTRSLVRALANLDLANSYSLFYAARGLPRPTPETKQADELFAQHPNFRAVPVPFSVRQMFAAWQRLRLPVPVDLFTGSC